MKNKIGFMLLITVLVLNGCIKQYSYNKVEERNKIKSKVIKTGKISEREREILIYGKIIFTRNIDSKKKIKRNIDSKPDIVYDENYFPDFTKNGEYIPPIMDYKNSEKGLCYAIAASRYTTEYNKIIPWADEKIRKQIYRENLENMGYEIKITRNISKTKKTVFKTNLKNSLSDGIKWVHRGFPNLNNDGSEIVPDGYLVYKGVILLNEEKWPKRYMAAPYYTLVENIDVRKQSKNQYINYCEETTKIIYTKNLNDSISKLERKGVFTEDSLVVYYVIPYKKGENWWENIPLEDYNNNWIQSEMFVAWIGSESKDLDMLNKYYTKNIGYYVKYGED
ncbi:hypothetical protein [Haliovirga abyssi]|uniref:Peptidase C1A papain C-terminal domain-containing protein n=1 Tax=Haliovirga abyssi TaxID=2996794 RepID=A0AAU9DSS0_9FUSO|nr:hypothetical protein [Haliovirga abyssi]BDU51688.1 hypothetical protein HLVA_22570 [Haliovirga abyssi]